MAGEVKVAKPAVARPLAPMLPNSGHGIDTPVLAKLFISWCEDENCYRVSTIGDGSCLFHAILKGTSDDYRNKETVAERIRMADAWRSELASDLEANWSTYTKRVDFEAKGWTVKNLTSLLRSRSNTGDEVMYVAAAQANVNIHVLTLYADGKWAMNSQVEIRESKRHIIVIGVNNHYELLVRKSDAYQVWFDPSDPLITGLSKLKTS